MRNAHTHIMFRLPLIGLLASWIEVYATVTEKAGTTIGNAPYITDTITMDVQSGANYIRIEPNHLPTTVNYMPEAPFGTIPVVMILGDTLPVQICFEDCMTGWKWEIPEKESTALVEIMSHEAALIKASPTMKTLENRIIESACDTFTYEGVLYTESGEYPLGVDTMPSGDLQVTILDLTVNYTQYDDTTVSQPTAYTGPSGKVYSEDGTYRDTMQMDNGCYRITIIQLTITTDEDYDADTVYFCKGFNSEHKEWTADGRLLRYHPYTFQSPSEWDFMDGVILQGERDRTLVDLRRAETNLYDHYVRELTPVSSIRWSVMYDDKNKYEPLTVSNEPQWIASGQVAVQVCFLCGEMYNTEFPTDIDYLSAETVSTKRIEKGRVVIIRGGAKYDILGTKIQ